MALLHVLWRVGQQNGWDVQAVTLDHGLRAEAADEAAMVGAYCAKLGVPHSVLNWTGWSGQGNLQAQARTARYAMIADWAHANGIGGVMIGHTANDIAETFLMRLARQAGVDGLAAMETSFERHNISWVRPFSRLMRADLRGYLDRHAVPFVDDPSNDDTRFERIKVRQSLAALADIGIDVDTLAGTAFHLQNEKSALQAYLAELSSRHADSNGAEVIIQQFCDNDPLHPEMERRLIIKALQYLTHAPYPPRHSAIAEMYKALGEGHTFALSGCIITKRAARRGSTYLITREANAVKNLTCRSGQIWDNRWQLDGPHAPNLEIRALGEAVKDCPNWREQGMTQRAIMASPAIWQGKTLIAAPLAGFNPLWNARIVTDFASFMLSH